jgi:putative oligomerization/nucleic acid binding protein
MPFNPLGLQPTIRDGIKGEGLVTKSAAGPDSSGVGEQKGFTGGFRRFSATTPMIVRVPEHPPFHVTPQRLASREKYAVVGMRLPLVVSRDLRRVRIEWDQVPTVDELIARGERMFTDPDSIAAELEEAWIEVAAHAGGSPPYRTPRPVFDRPTARVIAVGHGANDHESVIGKWELLLSVSVPGRPRFGYRFTKGVPRKALLLPGADIPVDVDGEDVRIPWDQIGSVTNFAKSLASLAQARRAAPPIESVAPAPPADDPGPSDPLDDLRRLGNLRDAGILTEAEFAAEKARVLDRI